MRITKQRKRKSQLDPQAHDVPMGGQRAGLRRSSPDPKVLVIGYHPAHT